MIAIFYIKTNMTELPRISNVDMYIDRNYRHSNYQTDVIIIILVKEGIAELSVSNGFKFFIHPGDVFLAVPGLTYECKACEGIHSHIALFVSDTVSFEIIEEKDIYESKCLFDTDTSKALENNRIIMPFHFMPVPGLEIEKEFNSMYLEYNNQIMCSSLVLSQSFLKIATAITRMCISCPPDQIKTDFKPAYNYIYTKKIIQYLNENYMKDLDIDFLACSLKLNRDYMCDVFRKTANYTLINYLNKLRINKAKELILRSDSKINSICKQVGINDEYYFSKLFKRMEGITPSRYRSYFRNSDTNTAQTDV